MGFALVLLMALSALVVLPGSVSGQGGQRPLVQTFLVPDTFAHVAEAVEPTVVEVAVLAWGSESDDDWPLAAPEDGEQIEPDLGVGSGVIVDESGVVLTNAHVVKGALAIAVKTPGGRRTRRRSSGWTRKRISPCSSSTPAESRSPPLGLAIRTRCASATG